jgi:enoyl-CoA hydratase/carnithine racemase
MENMNTSKLITIEARGRVAVVRLNREGKLNALSRQLEEELLAALDAAAVRSARAVVFTGGDKVFSAGADITEMQSSEPADVLAYYRGVGDVYERIAELPQPTISAICGYCLGGGLELALATDLRVADQSAVFGFPEVSIGIVPSSGGSARLARLLGLAVAKRLVLLGERLDSERALSTGLVHEVVATGQAPARALEWGQALARQPALALEVAKALLDRGAESPHASALLLERLGYAALATTPEARRAARAFSRKRKVSVRLPRPGPA